jgi:hypothetical protein
MGATCAVTRRRLELGARDDTTGWRAKKWTEKTAEGLLLPKGSQRLATSVGTYVRTDALFMTMDVLDEGDEVKSATNQYFEVHAAREIFVGDSFSHRECDLMFLPMHADVDYSIYGGTFLVDDARHRQKAYLDAYWSNSHCEDDGGQNLGRVVMYADPDYPLSMELESPSTVDLVITVAKPESKPLRGHDFTPYGYEEAVPVGIWSMDKANVTAVKAVQQGEAELRRILEDHPLGSLRGFETTREGTKTMGSAVLYGTEYKVTYLRDTT